MSELSQKIESRPKAKTQKRSRRWMFSTIIFGLILINIAIIADSNIFLGRYGRLFWFYLNPSHWPAWYAAVFWLILIGLWRAFRFKWGRRAVAGAVSAVIFTCSDCCAPIRDWLFGHAIALAIFPYKAFYVPYVYAPMVEYRTTGVLSLRLATLPLLGVLTVTVLLTVNRHLKNRKKGKENQ